MGEIDQHNDDDNGPVEQTNKRQRMRSIAIALALVVMVVLFYIATLVQLGENALNRPY